MDAYEHDIEELRWQLLNEAYAGAFSGLDALILDVSEIENTTDKKLVEIAKRYGIK